jgi:hypothetical protein
VPAGRVRSNKVWARLAHGNKRNGKVEQIVVQGRSSFDGVVKSGSCLKELLRSTAAQCDWQARQ